MTLPENRWERETYYLKGDSMKQPLYTHDDDCDDMYTECGCVVNDVEIIYCKTHAAAPDLLKALEKIVEDCTSPVTGEIELLPGEIAKAALAKAQP